MFLLSAKDGRMWIGGYSGVILYDGTVFDRLDTENGLTSARGLFQDSKGRVWAATNDNGVVVIDGNNRVHLTYKEGLPSSSIRVFSEDRDGNVFIGTTAGVCYADSELKIHEIAGADLSEERVLRLDADHNGKIYGQTSGGRIFCIENCSVTEVYSSEKLGMPKITTIMADPAESGKVWIGDETGTVRHGKFGSKASDMSETAIPELGGAVHWLSRDCGRIWVSSTSCVGYLDGSECHILEDIPINSGIEMTTSDYQGNLWVASSTQGVMKIVTNNFVEFSRNAGLPDEVANATCLHDGELYIGTDNGLRIVGKNGMAKRNRLTDFIGDSRVRCILEDKDGTLWISTYTNGLGLVRFKKNGEITTFTTSVGLPSNEVRSVSQTEDGSILAGTNSGLAVIKDGKIIRTVGADEGLVNTVILTACEYENGTVIAGSDGGGLYIISDDDIKKLDRDDGLTSEVIIRIVRDEKHDIYWLVTSNSIQFIKDGQIKQVRSFPFNNNYDIYFDDNGRGWILSSFGVYCVDAEQMLNDDITDHQLYTIAGGLPWAVTSNSYSEQTEDGELYIPARNGVIKVNINNFYEADERFLIDVRAVNFNDERIFPDEDGVYHLPASDGRVQISASVIDYTMLDPTVRMFLENGPDDGITVPLSQLSSLEYTNLPYGNYTLHLQVLDSSDGSVIQDSEFKINKSARLYELFLFQFLATALLVVLAGLIVWYVMRSTVIARQYEEISSAKDEAERANSAKSRFLANISHEIRTPINTIMGMNEMAMREDAEGVPDGYFMSMMNYAFDIRNASESLLGIINDLLDISKIESGRMQLSEQEYNIQDMLRSVVSMIRIRSSEKALTFDVVVDEILPSRLYGDSGRIKQILINFLTNAVKYTTVGGIILSVSMDERIGDIAKLRFSVKDTGLGIKDEDMDKLFLAYERLDEEATARYREQVWDWIFPEDSPNLWADGYGARASITKEASSFSPLSRKLSATSPWVCSPSMTTAV